MKHSRIALTLCLALAATLTFVACSAAAASDSNGESASRALHDNPTLDVPPEGGGSDPFDGDGKTDPGDPGTPGTGGDEPIDAPPVNEPPIDLPLPVGGATPVEPVPGVVDAIPHAWDHIDVASDGKTITVFYWGGVDSCYGLDRVDTTFDNGLLHVTVFEGRLGDLPADTACIEIAVLKSVTITLDQPVITPAE